MNQCHGCGVRLDMTVVNGLCYACQAAEQKRLGERAEMLQVAHARAEAAEARLARAEALLRCVECRDLPAVRAFLAEQKGAAVEQEWRARALEAEVLVAKAEALLLETQGFVEGTPWAAKRDELLAKIERG